jgi:hypothetical protein
MVEWETGKRWKPTEEGDMIVSRTARGISINSQTLSQICSQSDISACDCHAPCVTLRVLILPVHSGVAHSRSCLVCSRDTGG